VASKKKSDRKSAFNELGFSETLTALREEVRTLYLVDQIPWVLGYSGGKDSTATLQLVWTALQELDPDQLHKPVHVISTDTLVENPVVAIWVKHSLLAINQSASEQGLPIQAHALTPQTEGSFWVNLIGKGYPAPSSMFRWCTSRMKIEPSNRFINEVVKENGEAILILGTRKSESSKRSHVMSKLEKHRIRDRLSPNASLPNSLVFSPIEDWHNDDVWTYLMQVKNPWGYKNKDLLTMYQGASDDGECPLVVDTTTPSCGNSRFGCWVCTLVSEDKSMSAMIRNDQEKDWMRPLLDIRNKLAEKNKYKRDFRRMGGHVQIFNGEPIRGPYKQKYREDWLRMLLEAEVWIRENGPESVKDIELITLDELTAIRRLWVLEKHEVEDSLPQIYEGIKGVPFPAKPLHEHSSFGTGEVEVLREVCEDDEIHFELVRGLLAIQSSHRNMARRAGIFDEIEKSLRRGFYTDEEDAKQRALKRPSANKDRDPKPKLSKPRQQSLHLKVDQ
jgi:DNA sulfur modification protein DndC